MSFIEHLALGASESFTFFNLAYCLFGVTLGTLVGVLPGIGPVATMSVLLPITYGLPPVTALIMLAGIYYGAQYGGSTSAILLKMPGEVSSVMTALDGHAMALQGRAGAALTISAVGSFFGGSVATLFVAMAAPEISKAAMEIASPEYFCLLVLGLVASIVLARGSLIKALGTAALGLLIGLAGTDVNSGVIRFAFGVPELIDGVNFAIVAIGIFGLGEIITNLEQKAEDRPKKAQIGSMKMPWSDAITAAKASIRGTLVGSALGVLPGGGPALGAFSSYVLEKKIAKDPSRFGKGAIEGVAAAESANNAAAQTAFIPLLTLGIPSTSVMAVMAGGMMIHGITPGPNVMFVKPDLVWGLIVSMWAGNVMLLVLNLPMIGIWVKLLNVPYRLLFPAILLFCSVGVLTLNGSTTELYLMAGFGVFGYLLSKVGCEPAPLMLAIVLGGAFEENFRRSMLLSRGSLEIFLNRPICLFFLALALALTILTLAPLFSSARKKAFVEGQ
jgi:putative tricarboxylic transport membrane protein